MNLEKDIVGVGAHLQNLKKKILTPKSRVLGVLSERWKVTPLSVQNFQDA